MKSRRVSHGAEEEEGAGGSRARRKRKMAPQLLRVPKFRRPSITKRKRKRASLVECNVRGGVGWGWRALRPSHGKK